MPRRLGIPRDPEALTLTALALREYAGGGRGRTEFEAEFIEGLKDLGLSTAVAARLVANFDSIRPSVRERFLGPQGWADAVPPEGVARRDPTTVSMRGIALPGVLRPRPDDQVLAPRAFGIDYQGMHCVDETHWDLLWTSDEIYIITAAAHITPGGTNDVRTEGHPVSGAGTFGVYGDVDSGETRQGPVAACWYQPVANTVGGMSLTTVFWEHDKGDPDEYRDEVDQVVKAALVLASILYPGLGALWTLLATQSWLTDLFNWFLSTGDDAIGDGHTVVLTLSDLEDFGRSHPHKPYARGGITFNLPFHFVASVNDNDYFAAFTVRRDPQDFYQDPIVE